MQYDVSGWSYPQKLVLMRFPVFPMTKESMGIQQSNQFKAKGVLSLGSCTEQDNFILVTNSCSKYFYKIGEGKKQIAKVKIKSIKFLAGSWGGKGGRKKDRRELIAWCWLLSFLKELFFLNLTVRIHKILVVKIILHLNVPLVGRNIEKKLVSGNGLLCISTCNLKKIINPSRAWFCVDMILKIQGL